MPIYAYRCEACGHAKDVLQKFSDPLLTVCPSCGAEAFKKQVTAAGFQLKGSGWYVTDFRGDSKGGAAKADAVPADSGKADAAKTDGAAPDKGKAEPAKGEAASKSTPAPAVAPAPPSGPGPASGVQ
jgi:putative FmdB family regulatory protein